MLGPMARGAFWIDKQPMRAECDMCAPRYCTQSLIWNQQLLPVKRLVFVIGPVYFVGRRNLFRLMLQ